MAGEGEGDFIVPFDVAGYARAPGRSCSTAQPGDQVGFTTPDGPRVLPGGSAYITGNIEGFVRGDVVEQMTRHGDGGPGSWDGVWQVVARGLRRSRRWSSGA